MSPRCILRLVLTIVMALVVLGATPAAFGQATSITSTGFRASEGGGGALTTEWTTGNLGNTWAEGEWVPYQLIISNVQTDYPGMVGFPDIIMEYDFTAQNDARFVDLVRSIQVGDTRLTDAQGWPADNGLPFPMGTRQQIENAQNDIGNTMPLENSWDGFTLLNLPNSQVNRSSPPGFGDGSPSDQFRYFYITRQDLIDAGLDTTTNTIIVYYQLHESRSFIWGNSLQEAYDASPTDDWGGYLYSLPAFAADSRLGSGYVPGSSGQLRVSFASGDKTVPIPIPERLPGSISGLKWHDIDGDGVIDGGEPMLSGWRIYVSGTLEGIFFSEDTLTDGSGVYSFPNLTSNVNWSIFEASQQAVPPTTGWSQTYPSPGTTVGVGAGTDFGFNSDTANVGWLVALTEDVYDQPDMNFGNRLCEVVINCPPDVELECDAPNTPDATGYPVVVTGNCGPLDTSYTDNVLQGVCGVDGFVAQIERTWVVADAFGNADTCIQVITQVDTTPPILPAPPADVTLQCDADLTPPSLSPPTDNCDPDPIVSQRQDIIPGDCPQSYTIINWWIATDHCGNADSVYQTVTVVDTEAPVLIGVPEDASYECTAPAPPIVTAEDNCDLDVPVMFTADTTGSCPATITRTWTATDDCGNTTSQSQVIMLIDETAPTLIGVPVDASYECSDAYPDTATVTAEDNCDPSPVVGFSEVITPGQCANEYTITRTWTASDSCGNADTAIQVITIQDTTPPEIACPDDLLLECDAVGDFGWPTATDNCDPEPAISLIDRDSTAGDCAAAYTLVLTYEAMDACGNADTCAQTITVVDTTPPVIACPDDINANCDDVPDFGTATATDNCDADPAVRYEDDTLSTTCPLEIARMWIAVDGCGNADTCVQSIIVDDTTPPVLSCPDDLQFECDAVGDFGFPTATDNCTTEPAISLIGRDSTAGDCAAAYTLLLTYEAVDACGNADTCAQTITVVDTTPPEIACPDDLLFECDDVGEFGTPDVTDNCDPDPQWELADRDSVATCPQGYVLTLTYRATDACGNSSTCEQVITVEDRTPPVLTCAEDGRVECNDEVVFTPPGVSDNCDPAPVVSIVSTDTIPGPTLGEVTHTRTWVAVDACGNQSIPCSQSIIVLPCPDTGCTFTQGGWGSNCPPGQQGDMMSTQPGCIRDNYFDQVFPNGVTIGDPSGFTATWTTAAAVHDYLPAGGVPRSLNQNYVDPTSTSAGVLGGQILALTLNVAYSCGGAFDEVGIGQPGFCYAYFTVPDYCGKFAGITVDSFLTLANLVLSGHVEAVEGYEATWSDINFTATCLNEMFDNCDPSARSISITDVARAGLILGDVNYDHRLATSDLIYLAQYVLGYGAAPVPFLVVGDADWNGRVEIADVLFLADWILRQPVLISSLQATSVDQK